CSSDPTCIPNCTMSFPDGENLAVADVAPYSACDEHHPVAQQRRRVVLPSCRHVAGGRESAGLWVVKLRAFAGRACENTSTGREHLPVRQQCCRVLFPCHGHATSGGEHLSHCVVYLGAREPADVVASASNEYLPILQQRRRVKRPCHRHAACGRERPGTRVV